MDVGASFDGLALGAVLSAFGLGLRHGFDWDHVAAITDITSSQGDTRRSMEFSTLYIAGHGVVVTGLGLVAIAAGSTIPGWLDGAMGRVIGVTLIALGVYVLVSLMRHGRDARMRSRWMLAIAGARRALRWIRGGRSQTVVIEHDHGHPEVEAHPVPVAEMVPAARQSSSDAGWHRHHHRHVASVPDDPFLDYGRGTSFLVGMLHGVGAETPTQMALFATA
ncbi:MAG: hypothetical protein HYU28_11060, partial [Actinobacteria bacterium]|nr:hypothetical protein [Actinomycetota bacterium]